MWRGFSTYCSTRTRSSPNALFDFALARGERGGEVLALVDPAHALAAAAGAGLDQHREADLAGLAREQLRVLVVAVIAGRERHAGLGHERLGGRLRAHRADRRRRRTDEDDAFLRARLGEGGVLRQEAVARMDRLGAGRLGGGDDLGADQVRLARRRRADVHRFVGHANVARIGVGVGIDGDGGDAHPARRLDDPAGDLAAVGDQNLAEHFSCLSFFAHAALARGSPAPAPCPPSQG